MEPRVAAKPQQFEESVIRLMTRLCTAVNGINLAQGFPDFPAPQAIKDAACAAIQADINQYAITWGAPALRTAIAEKYSPVFGRALDPEREITVVCGATEAMLAAMLAVVDPGDEVVVFEPFYENYGPDAVLAGARPRYVPLHPPDWRFDPDALRAAFGPRTRAIVVNTPHNPTGKVFTREELAQIAALCQQWNVVAITDEIYEHLVYEGEHVRLATLPGMWERTITISGLSKTYSVTGWRLGYLIAPERLTTPIRRVHDFLTVGAAAPLQEAAAVALRLPPSYYTALLADYSERRAVLCAGLEAAGFRVYRPAGAYYVMTDITDLVTASAAGGEPLADDVAFVRAMIERVGVAAVPGSSFYADRARGRTQVRFAFPKQRATLEEAVRRLAGLRAALCRAP
ncbi:MAG TPA: aminotransferase class I/II-fold pyridoxal phosphate-dependent enzyme [Chloroflexota bacterium]|nr:aminotransferase class I/II-fold pyridoxal phosphate-dependent enzyme [Chloroflexota bacterium]